MIKTVSIMNSIFTFEQDSGELIKVHQFEIPVEQRIVTKDSGWVNGSYLLMHAMDLVRFWDLN
jgi:hypothetical protein